MRNDTDEVVELDPATGAIISAVDINDEGVPFDAGSCGMSFDCHAQQLLYGHGPGGDVMRTAVDAPNGWTTVLARYTEQANGEDAVPSGG